MYTNSLNTGTVYPPPAGTLHKVYIRILYTEHQLLQELYTEVAWTGKALLLSLLTCARPHHCSQWLSRIGGMELLNAIVIFIVCLLT